MEARTCSGCSPDDGRPEGESMKTLQRAKTIRAKDRKLLEECKGIIRKHLPDATVLLYGSVARGTQEPYSDYDLAVLTERSLSATEEERIHDALYDLELDRGVVICALFFSTNEWSTPLHQAMPLHRSIEEDGILL
ncbi:MAG: nucleotidyltransferase domain-containing protein [Planctomycetes bacterium]|nr:nucleotidyltransferase domain-containing protein [Planctomycetota bacterium]